MRACCTTPGCRYEHEITAARGYQYKQATPKLRKVNGKWCKGTQIEILPRCPRCDGLLRVEPSRRKTGA
jgi:hypothetical protein